MSRYLLDTNLLVYSLRDDSRWGDLCKTYPIGERNNFISVVSLGELWSLALRNAWGEKRLAKLQNLSQSFIVVDINIDAIIRRYAEIDAFSQNRLKGRPLGGSARNMGKNDLWIAATASALDLTLLSTDQDFAHLSPDFVQWAQV